MTCFARRYLPSCAALSLVSESPHGNHYPSHPGTTGGGRCCSCRDRSWPTWRLDAAGALRSSRTCPGRPAQQAAQSFSQARYPGSLPAADRGLPVRGGCHGLHGCPETDQELLNIKGVISIKKSPHSGLQS